MAESVVSVLVEAAKPICEALGNRVLEEINLVWGFGNELKKLQRKIEPIANIVLKMSDVDESVEPWLRSVIRILYETENLMDVLAYEKQRAVVKKRRAQRSITGKTRLVFWPLKRLYFRRKIGKWISRIDSDFGEALKLTQTIVQLRTLAASPARNINCLQELRRNVDMSLFVGRDSDVDIVVEKLCNPSQDCKTSNNRLSVVAIVGFGGIGKTSLAKQVSENKQVKNHFHERIIFINVSEKFGIDKILNEMVEFLERAKHESTSTEIAIGKLEERLGGKRYLLVLDDVWNTHQDIWDSLKSSLDRIGATESMVLVTTRDDAVAKTMRASLVHHLSELSIEESWSLFEKIALANRSKEEASMLKASGKEIVKKCKGVPLAIKSIGGMLRDKRNLHEWEIIEQSELWDLEEDNTGILPSLKLSYNYLPTPYLKKCFALCALMPKGYILYKDGLIQIWMALGLIQQPRNRNLMMEDIGELYINEMTRISFLQGHEKDDVGEIYSYTMHDLVYDLARFVGNHHMSLLLEDTNGVKSTSDIAHLSMCLPMEISSEILDRSALGNLRSLFIYKSFQGKLLMHVNHLRVLVLGDLGLEMVPKSIAGMKCLKLLDLSFNPIKVLPDFISELYSLESLLLYNCETLSEIPTAMNNLVKLRHFDTSLYWEFSAGVIGQMSCLQTVPPLLLSEGGLHISELGGLLYISGYLDIAGLELIKSKHDAEMANLLEKPRVKRFHLSWRSDDNWMKHEEVLDGLFPNPSIRLLSISGYGGEKFPSWLTRMDVPLEPKYQSALCNLIKLELVDCRRCLELPTLGHLPFLKSLDVRNMENLKHISSGIYGYAELFSQNDVKTASIVSSSGLKSIVYFPKLEELRLCGLPNLVEWCQPSSESWTGFPSLEVLEIKECPELRSTPNRFPALKQLIIKNMTSSQPLLNFLTNESSSRASLIKLHIEGVVELTHLPEDLAECTSLQILTIIRFPNLTCLPESLSELLSLEALTIRWCLNLVSLPSLRNLGLLRELDILDNPSLTSAPEGLQNCKSLEKLWVYDCKKVETLPDLTGLSRLSNLNIMSMTKMISQPPDWLYSLPCLRILHIGSYWELNEFPDISFLLNINSLECLYVYGWEKRQSVPEQLQYFTALQGLGIAGFDDQEYLPDWLGNLSSLRALHFSSWKKLKKLASEEAMKRLTKLNYLRIRECPELEEAIKINGTEHHKISPQIQVECINSVTNN